MAPPSGFAAFKNYSTELGGPPQHAGSRYMYGPFVVTPKTDINSADFLLSGRTVILGVGWTSPGATLPADFHWGVLSRVGGNYVLQYFTKVTGEDGDGNETVTIGQGVRHQPYKATGKIDFSTSASGDIRVAVATGASIGTSFDNQFAIAASGGAFPAASETGGQTSLLLSHYGKVLDAYWFTFPDSAKDEYSVKRFYSHPVNAGVEYYRVRDVSTGTDKKSRDNKDKLADFARGGGAIYPASHTTALNASNDSASTDIFSLTNKSFYFEQTMYGDDGKVYRTHSSKVPLSVLLGGGEVTLNVKYWQGPTPIDKERYPYEIREIRFDTATGKGISNYAFWAADDPLPAAPSAAPSSGKKYALSVDHATGALSWIQVTPA